MAFGSVLHPQEIVGRQDIGSTAEGETTAQHCCAMQVKQKWRQNRPLSAR